MSGRWRGDRFSSHQRRYVEALQYLFTSGVEERWPAEMRRKRPLRCSRMTFSSGSVSTHPWTILTYVVSGWPLPARETCAVAVKFGSDNSVNGTASSVGVRLRLMFPSLKHHDIHCTFAINVMNMFCLNHILVLLNLYTPMQSIS